MYTVYIRSESSCCGWTLILFFKNTVDNSGNKQFDI